MPFEPPTLDELRQVSTQLGLRLTDADLEEFGVILLGRLRRLRGRWRDARLRAGGDIRSSRVIDLRGPKTRTVREKMLQNRLASIGRIPARCSYTPRPRTLSRRTCLAW